MKPLNQAKRKEVGKYMGPEMLDHMTDEQIVQLYELHKAAKAIEDDASERTKKWAHSVNDKVESWVTSWATIEQTFSLY